MHGHVPSFRQVDYSGFGDSGIHFQGMYAEFIRRAFAHWGKLPIAAQHGFADAVQYLDRSTSWIVLFFHGCTSANGFVSMDDVDSFWNSFRQAFNPPLVEHHNWDTNDPGSLQMALALLAQSSFVKARSDKAIQEELGLLNRICFGPFREDEIEFLLKHDPQIIEIGAGSGYFAQEFLSRGGRIKAVDSYNYRQNETPVNTWTETLLESGHLEIGGPEVVADYTDHTLLISWPQAGSDFPLKALRTFWKAGGKRFAFKLGGFTGRTIVSDGSSIAPENPKKNIRDFFEYLSTHGQQVAGPEFCIGDPYNNLWIFEAAEG